MNRNAPLSAIALLGLLAGCVPVPQPIMAQPVMTQPVVAQPPPPGVLLAYPPVPPPRVEVIPAPPPRRREVMVWQPGHWHWDGYRYDWLPGRYTERLVGTTRWVPGHWVPRPGGYAWAPGHWG